MKDLSVSPTLHHPVKLFRTCSKHNNTTSVNDQTHLWKISPRKRQLLRSSTEYLLLFLLRLGLMITLVYLNLGAFSPLKTVLTRSCFASAGLNLRFGFGNRRVVAIGRILYSLSRSLAYRLHSLLAFPFRLTRYPGVLLVLRFQRCGSLPFPFVSSLWPRRFRFLLLTLGLLLLFPLSRRTCSNSFSLCLRLPI